MPGSKEARPRLDQDFVGGSLATPAGDVPVVPSRLTWRDRFGALRVRCGIGRYRYTVDPGLYAVGSPTPLSPVVVSANYKLSFDVLRRCLAGRDAWILVLDTRGINVWCAAGKGTFGADELVRRIGSSDLSLVAASGIVILPQLAAPGVAAPDVRRRTGFRAVYGPVRASDLPAYLDAGMRATTEMRRVRFTMRDRLVLAPVEIVNVLAVALAVAAGAALVSGFGRGSFSMARALSAVGPVAAVVSATVLSGALLTPMLLPWLPGRMFALKGAEMGALSAIAVLAPLAGSLGMPRSAAAALFIVAGSSFVAMNFTGTSTFTSLHGVEREMRAAMPWQIAAASIAAVLWIVTGLVA